MPYYTQDILQPFLKYAGKQPWLHREGWIHEHQEFPEPFSEDEARLSAEGKVIRDTLGGLLIRGTPVKMSEEIVDALEGTAAFFDKKIEVHSGGQLVSTVDKSISQDGENLVLTYKVNGNVEQMVECLKEYGISEIELLGKSLADELPKLARQSGSRPRF